MEAGLGAVPYCRVRTGCAIPAGRPETTGGQRGGRGWIAATGMSWLPSQRWQGVLQMEVSCMCHSLDSEVALLSELARVPGAMSPAKPGCRPPSSLHSQFMGCSQMISFTAALPFLSDETVALLNLSIFLLSLLSRM